MSMTTEQREAIEYLKDMKNNQKDLNKSGYVYANEKIDTVLSLIKQLESEKEIHVGLEHQYKKEYLDMLDLTKKYKRQIDLMAEEIANSIINTCPLADYDFDLNCENRCSDNTKECWKIYFERKAENEK